MIVLLTATWLTGCATAGSERPPSPPPVQRARVPVRDYTPDFQRQAAEALGQLPAGSPLRPMIADYGQLRRAVCATQGTPKSPACRRIEGQ